jgi:hypothetical protein
VKSAISVDEEVRAPLSAIDVNMEQESILSSLPGVDGVENLLEMTSAKKAGHLKGSTCTNASADNENQ